MKTTRFNLQLFAEPAVNFEEILKKHAGEDGSIAADGISKAAQAIASAVGRAFVDKARYNAKLDEIAQLEQDKQAAEDSATKAGKWEERYNKEHEAFEKFKADADARSLLDKKKAAYKKLLSEQSIDAKRHDAILRATPFDSLTLDKDGNLEKADELKADIDRDWGDFKTTTIVKGAPVATPPVNNGPAKKTREEIMAIKDAGARQRAIAENHELFGF